MPERAPARRSGRNTPSGSPAQGASAPQPASRPEGEGRAGLCERSARRGRARQERSSQSQRQGQRGQNQPYKTHILYDILAIQNISRVLYDWIAARRARRRGRAARLSAAPPERRARSLRGRQLRTKAAPTPQMVIFGCSRGDFVTVGLRPPVVHALPRILPTDFRLCSRLLALYSLLFRGFSPHHR